MTDFHTLSHDQQVAKLHDLARHALQQWDGAFAEIELVKFRENAVFSARREDLANGSPCASTATAITAKRRCVRSCNGWKRWPRPALPCRRSSARKTSATWSKCCMPTSANRAMSTCSPGCPAPAGTSEAGVQADTEIDFLFAEAGALAARIHLHAADWQQPDEFVRHAWDEDGLIGANPFWGRFWDLEQLSVDQRELLQQARRRARSDLRRYGRQLGNFGMIHADLVPENLLIEGENLG